MSKVEKFQEKLNEKYPNEKVEALTYTYAKQPAEVLCLECGSKYTLLAENFLLKNKSKVCSKCVPNKSDALDRRIRFFYDFMEKSDDFLVDREFKIKSSHDKIPCLCKKCKTTNYKTMYDYMKGQKCLCTTTNRIKEKFMCPDGIEIVGKYEGMHKNTLFRHSCGFVWKAKPNNIKYGKGCPKCNKRQSKGEQIIEQFLKKNNISYEKEFNVVLEGNSLRTDFYIPEKDFHIEYQGIQHFEPVEFFGEKRDTIDKCFSMDLKRNIWISEKSSTQMKI